MKRDGLLNPQLNQAIARLGHTDAFAICDCGKEMATANANAERIVFVI